MAETTVTVVATKREALDPYIKILQTRSNDIDVSFSSFLKPNNNNEQQKNEQEDTELSIFEARRYFSESGNERSKTKNLIASPRFSSVSSFTVGHTAASSSEVSWNSQTGLLRNNNRIESNRRGSSSNNNSKKGWFFRRRTCPCSSSKSVQVQETKPRIAVESKTGSNRIVHHHHQTISSSSDPIRLTIPSNTATRSIDYLANKESKAPVSNFSFPTLNATSQASEKPQNPVQPVLNPVKPVLNRIEPVLNPVKPVMNPISDEEAASDASSDLFEIESFSAPLAARQWAPPNRNSIDETETEYGYYEPSETSVTWSVTTAEPASAVAVAVAANFSRIGLSSASLGFSGCDKKRTAGLLSCRCEKAVTVNSGQRLVQPVKSVCVQDAEKSGSF